jgi:hypothetical protein
MTTFKDHLYTIKFTTENKPGRLGGTDLGRGDKTYLVGVMQGEKERKHC